MRFDVSDRGLRDSLRLEAKASGDLRDGGGLAALVAYDFTARDSRGAVVRRFEKPVTITIRYGGLPLTGIDESGLTIVYYDPDRQVWTDQPSAANVGEKQVSADVEHFSKHGVSGKSAAAAGSVSLGSTPVARGGAAVATGTVTSGGNPVAGGAVAGGTVRKHDATTVMNSFKQAVYGRTYSYSDTGLAAAGVIASPSFPKNEKGVLTAKVGVAGAAAYGRGSNLIEVALAGRGGAVTNGAAADIAAAGVGEVAQTGAAFPADQASASRW